MIPKYTYLEIRTSDECAISHGTLEDLVSFVFTLLVSTNGSIIRRDFYSITSSANIERQNYHGAKKAGLLDLVIQAQYGASM